MVYQTGAGIFSHLHNISTSSNLCNYLKAADFSPEKTPIEEQADIVKGLTKQGAYDIKHAGSKKDNLYFRSLFDI